MQEFRRLSAARSVDRQARDMSTSEDCCVHYVVAQVIVPRKRRSCSPAERIVRDLAYICLEVNDERPEK